MKPAFCTPGTLLGCYPLGQGHSREGGKDQGEEQDERRGNDEEAGAPRCFSSDLLVATPSFWASLPLMAWRSDIPVAPIVGPSSSSQPTPKPIMLRLAPHLAPSQP
jgi:hypothetical protein